MAAVDAADAAVAWARAASFKPASVEAIVYGGTSKWERSSCCPWAK